VTQPAALIVVPDARDQTKSIAMVFRKEAGNDYVAGTLCSNGLIVTGGGGLSAA